MGVKDMAESRLIELELDQEHYDALESEAKRLKTTVEDLAHRAIGVWLSEMEEEDARS